MRFETIVRDIRHTLRGMRRNPAFSLFVILIAGLGIGASVTVFSVVNTLLLRPPPFADPGGLVWIANGNVSGLSGQTTQVDHLKDLAERSRTMTAVAGYFAFYGVGDNLLSGSGEPERVSGVPVTGNFFQVLGIQPAHGRLFTAAETQWNGPNAVILAHAFWQRRFGGDPAVVGQSLTINDEPHTIVGVLPPSFDFGSVFAPGSRFDLFFPFPLTPETNRWGNTMAMIGRLAPRASVGEAQAEVRTIAAQLTSEHPQRNSFGGNVRPLAEQVSGRFRLAVWVLAGSVGLVMLIVCANLSNLLLARTASRQKEFAIRSALGAGSRRLVVQCLTESLLLSCSGAVLGVLLGWLGIQLLAQLDAISIPMLRQVRLDGTALSFAVAMAIGAGVVFGLAPALQARTAVHDTLKDGSRGSTEGRRRRWLRNALVVSEVAFACVLLVGAGLLIRSLVRVLDVEMGFDPAKAATVRVDPDSRYSTRPQRDAYIDEVLRISREIPGVEAAAITDALPLGRNRTWGARAKGVTYERGRGPSAYIRIVTDGYPAAMRIPVVAGRDLAPTDNAAAEPVVMINESMARALWPGQDPIGKVVLNACGSERRVIGVLGDVRHLALEQGSGNEMYIPMRQCGDRSSYDLVLRSTTAPSALAGTVRQALKPVAPNLVTNDFRTIQQIVDKSVSPRRFTVLLLAGFAGFALVLASLGIYALISYSVSGRTQEIGIRMALGATRQDVQRQIVGQTLVLAAAGVALGALASWGLARAMAGLLFEVTPGDPTTFAAMAVLLTGVALLAGYVPARRASSIDPMAALRS